MIITEKRNELISHYHYLKIYMQFRLYIQLEANGIQSAGSNCFIIRFMNCIYI